MTHMLPNGKPLANTPYNIWPNMAPLLHDDLRWVVENQSAIVAAAKARPMPTPRPVKAWCDGRVRVEFVGTFQSARAVRDKYDTQQDNPTHPEGGSR